MPDTAQSTDTAPLPSVADSPVLIASSTPLSIPRHVVEQGELGEIVSNTQETASIPEPLSTFDHNDLPTELWLEIFRYATYVPRSRDLTVVDPFAPERLPNFAWGVNNPVLSLRTKCTLVGVCRSWRKIATELLYEHVVVASVHRAKLIIRTLQESAVAAKKAASTFEQVAPSTTGTSSESTTSSSAKTQGLAKGHGQWVRHLEIRSCTRNTNKLTFLRLVAIILTYTTGLRVLNGVWTIPVPKEFLAVVQHYHGKTLRGLGWEQTEQAFKYAVKDIHPGSPNIGSVGAILSPQFLPLFQQLRILDLRTLPKSAIMAQYHSDFGDLGGESDIPTLVPINELPTNFTVPPPVMVLPHVTTLRLPTTTALLTYASKIALPALRDLLLDASNVLPYHMASPTLPASHHVTTLTISLLLFLTVHGHALTSLELVPSVSSTYKPSPYPLSPGLFLQPGVCPNLERLVYDCRERCMVLPVSLSMVRGIRSKADKNLKVDTLPTKASSTASKTPSLASPAPEPKDFKDLTYLLTSPVSTDLLMHPHRSLRLIAIRGLGISRLYPNRPTHTQSQLLALLSARMSGFLPALETVRTAGFMVDTSTDGLARDIFIWWTERFEHMGVDLVDGEGVMWLYEEEKVAEKVKEGKGKEGEPGDISVGDEKGLKEGSSQSEGASSSTQVGKTVEAEKEDPQSAVTCKVYNDGSLKEVLFLPADCPNYVHKNDPTERAAKDAGLDLD
ncbi:hypothetical protein EIP91_003103 [Steccherinum ochraceum]|uniref:Uncharacterized protein n=1 Tax=Steccherinum ochraceum TaxID=92696 RepID=A0A4R0RRL4_9APHY|nr:hypothetical protein EIP91_003103 [Steccherinum ochraceum]